MHCLHTLVVEEVSYILSLLLFLHIQVFVVELQVKLVESLQVQVLLDKVASVEFRVPSYGLSSVPLPHSLQDSPILISLLPVQLVTQLYDEVLQT